MHKPRKRFGQHFLQDATIISRIIAELAPKAEDTLVEIGPGLGALTLPLLKQTGSLQVVELDRDVIPRLEQACQRLGELTVHQADVLDFDFHQCLRGEAPLRVVGNLPYNISTPLLFHLFKQLDCIKDMVFMLQKEVVDRITASPNTKDYGRLSIMVQYFCETRNLFDVPPEAFKPPPKVMSAVVHLKPHTEKPFVAKDEKLFADLVRKAFNQRRKTIRNSLQNTGDLDPNLRPENLSVEDFVNLSNSWGE